MKQQIEKIIKKNLPEKVDEKEAKFVDDPNNLLGEGYSIGFNQALSQIDTSLIADEVLKVVVENITKFATYNYHNGERYIEFKEENLLSNLSLKENENI